MAKLYNYLEFPNLESSRLRLRPVLNKDQSLIFHLRSDPDLNQYILRKPMGNLSEALGFIQDNESKVREGKLIHWTLELKSNQLGIGNICLWNFSEDKKTAELGYSMLKQYHGHGLMSEAVSAVIYFGFDELLLDKIEAYTQFDNEKSIALLNRFNFRKDTAQQDPYNEKNLVYYLENNSAMK